MAECGDDDDDDDEENNFFKKLVELRVSQSLASNLSILDRTCPKWNEPVLGGTALALH